MVYVGILLTVEPPGTELLHIKFKVKGYARKIICPICQIHAKYNDALAHKNKPYQGQKPGRASTTKYHSGLGSDYQCPH